MLHGERLDRPTYAVLQSALHSGNTGEIVLTHHEIFNVPVVQKTVSLLGIPDALARSEPRLLEGLSHEHLIRVREAQWDPDQPSDLVCVTFTMDFYAGRCIHVALQEGHCFSVTETLGIIAGLLEACIYLHDQQKMLHRDIKPANVLLDGDRRHPYLGDLGSAARLAADNTTDDMGNTPLYRAPEAVNGVIDVRSDLYGVGCVMLEMLNGPLDYESIDRDRVEDRLAQGRRALVNRLYDPAPWVPADVARVLRKLIAANPGDRYPNARTALSAVRRVRAVSWRRTSGDGLQGVWVGRYPPSVAPARARTHEVSATLIESGRHAGQVQLGARWRRSSTADWRNYASLARRVPADDSGALAAFFRAVEAEAQRAPTS